MSRQGFRLATVERLRQRRLEDAARALHTTQLALRAAQARRDDLVAQLRSQRHCENTAYQLELESVYRFRLRSDLAEVDHEREQLLTRLAGQREVWLRARAEAHAVATLHERHREQQMRTVLRAEQKDMDERSGTGRRTPLTRTGEGPGGA